MEPDDLLANFVIDSDKLKSDSVHWKAFLPERRTQERSVFCVTGMAELAIAHLGQELVAAPRGRAIKGWAEFTVAVVASTGSLTARRDEPPPNHVVIVDWPTEPEQQRLLAMQLASKAIRKEWPPKDQNA
jgi:hypothetical protein